MTKVTSPWSSHFSPRSSVRSGEATRSISLGFLGDFSDIDFHPSFYEGFGLDRLIELPLTADVLVYAYGSSRPLEEFEARGTPVVVVDEGNSPSVSPDLVDLLSRPEVRACFRRYGFRDTASYFRNVDYYEEAYRIADVYDSPPDHFPVYVDDPIGNAVRKIQVCLPIGGDVLPEFVGNLQGCTASLAERARDVLVVEGESNPRTELLSRLWGGLPVDDKLWFVVDDVGSPEMASIVDLMRGSRIFLSDGFFSVYDFYAVSCGCVVIKPECSNVVASIDIFDPLKSYIRYCDIGFKDLFPVVSEVLRDIESHRESNLDITRLFSAADAHSWGFHLRKTCQDVLDGRSRLGDVSSPLPLV